MLDTSKEWFEEWFDSPYYDLLYNKRNEEEAALFIDHLLNVPKIRNAKTVLDLACGKGRHSIYLHQKGFDVTGIDLSKRSIAYAKTFEEPGLRFFVQDMRCPLINTTFDVIMNLFTSFGYFEEMQDNIKVLQSVYDMLNPGGIFVLDYLNTESLPSHFDREEHKQFPEAEFILKKSKKDGFVVKDIVLLVGGKQKHFQEKVRLFDKKDFETMFASVGLSVLHVFGDYDSSGYQSERSPRLIFVAQKD